MAVIVPIHDYEKMVDAIEELEDIKLYDEAKNEDDGSRTSLEDYLHNRKSP